MFESGTATSFDDLLTKLDTFLTTNGSAYGLAAGASNVGNGNVTAYRGGASSVAETFTLTATSSTSFNVVGSVSGSLGTATVGSAFSHAKLAFTLVAGGTAFASGDTFTLSTAPKWTRMRGEGRTVVTASSANTGQNAGQNVLDGKQAADGNRSWIPTEVVTLQFDFPVARTIVEYAIRVGSSSATPDDWTFEYWDGAAWQVLHTVLNEAAWTSGMKRAYTIPSPVSATRYRINITDGDSTTHTIAAVELRTAAGGHNAAFAQYVWKAPGNDGTSEIYVGVHPFFRTDADYWNWELAGFDGFNSTTEFYQQANFHGAVYLPLWNGSIPYWFSCNGRCVRIVVKVNTQYEVAWLGLLEPYFSPQQMAYPLALGGSLAFGSSLPVWDSTSWRWSNSTNQHRAFTHADPNASSFTVVSQSQLRFRLPTGGWTGFVASLQDIFTALNGDNMIWPYGGDFSQLEVNINGSYATFPVVLLTATNTYGQLDGIAAVTGQGLAAETLIRVGKVDYLAVPNIFRTDRNDFLAVRLD